MSKFFFCHSNSVVWLRRFYETPFSRSGGQTDRKTNIKTCITALYRQINTIDAQYPLDVLFMNSKDLILNINSFMYIPLLSQHTYHTWQDFLLQHNPSPSFLQLRMLTELQCALPQTWCHYLTSTVLHKTKVTF